MTLLQIKTLEQLVEEIRRCTCKGRCMRCIAVLDRMDLIIERAYQDTVRDTLKKGKRS